MDILRPYIEERNANDIGYIIQTQRAVTDKERMEAKIFAMQKQDSWFNGFYPFVMSYKDQINLFSFKEYRKDHNLNFGDIGRLKALEACVEGHSNILVNRRTGKPFHDRKEIADYLQDDRRNVSNSITRLIKAGLIYVPPGTKHFAMSETITTCGKINEEGYRRRHELSQGVERKSKTENIDHKGNTKREKEFLRQQRLRAGLPPIQESEYPIRLKNEYPYPSSFEGIRGMKTEPCVEQDRDTVFHDDEIPF